MQSSYRIVLISICLGMSSCKENSAKANLPEEIEPSSFGTTGSTGSPIAVSSEKETVSSTNPVLSGTLEPHRKSTLMPRVGGPVAKVHVREGDLVKRGALLVSIDPEQYSLTLRQAELGLAGAKVQFEAIKIEYDRHKSLLSQKAIPKSQFDMIDAKYKGALVGVQAAEVSLAQARKAQRDAAIRAPYTGVVTKKHVSEGDMATSMPPTALITIEETEILDLRVQIPSVNMDRVHIGDEITVHFTAEAKDIKAKISRIIPTINPGTRTFPVIVEIDNSQGFYRSGLFAEVKLNKTLTVKAED